MKKKNSRKKQAKLLRVFRKIHRSTGAALFIFFFIMSISGLFLGWKKNSSGVIMPHSQNGISSDLKKWLPIDSLYKKAIVIAHDSIDKKMSKKLDKIEIKKDKGMVKFIFKEDFWEIQVDGVTGNALSIQKRYSDLLENIHDGSILDDYFKTSNNQIKVFYNSVMGISLLIFTLTGFWLWYGPKQMKKRKATKL